MNREQTVNANGEVSLGVQVQPIHRDSSID